MLDDKVWLTVEVQFIPKVLDGVEVRALCRPVKFSLTELRKPFLYGPHCVQGRNVMLKLEKGLIQTVTRKLKYNCML